MTTPRRTTRAYKEQLAILTMYGPLDPATCDDVNHGLRRVRELYALQAIEAYRGSGEAQHLAKAARLSPRTTIQRSCSGLARGSTAHERSLPRIQQSPTTASRRSHASPHAAVMRRSNSRYTPSRSRSDSVRRSSEASRSASRRVTAGVPSSTGLHSGFGSFGIGKRPTLNVSTSIVNPMRRQTLSICCIDTGLMWPLPS